MDLHLRSSWLELAPTGEWTYCSHLHRKISLSHSINIYIYIYTKLNGADKNHIKTL
jgi:hypothetical protein